MFENHEKFIGFSSVADAAWDSLMPSKLFVITYHDHNLANGDTTYQTAEDTSTYRIQRGLAWAKGSQSTREKAEHTPWPPFISYTASCVHQRSGFDSDLTEPRPSSEEL